MAENGNKGMYPLVNQHGRLEICPHVLNRKYIFIEISIFHPGMVDVTIIIWVDTSQGQFGEAVS